MTAAVADLSEHRDRTPRSYVLQTDALSVSVTDFGATITGIRCPDRHGNSDDVLLGFSDLDQLLRASEDLAWCYPGSTVGRFANRISGAGFWLDGIRHYLAANEGDRQLHGGPSGFDRRLWTATMLEGEVGVRFGLLSPDGDQGFPGALDVAVEMVVTPPATLTLRYAAQTNAPTHLNLTNHGYFNLDGARRRTTIEDHALEIAADRFLPADEHGMPSGEIASVAGTPFDFRQPRRIGDALCVPDPQLTLGDGFNHCFVLDGAAGLRRAAVLSAPVSGRRMEVWTSEPGVQLYTGNALAAAGGLFHRREALCLETQHFPDSPNHPHFPSTVLRPGETWRSTTELRFFRDG